MHGRANANRREDLRHPGSRGRRQVARLGWSALARTATWADRRLPLRVHALGMVREEAKGRDAQRRVRPRSGGTLRRWPGLDEDEVEAWAEASGKKGQGAAGGKAAELAEALEKWSVRCEMGGTIGPLSGCLARC